MEELTFSSVEIITATLYNFFLCWLPLGFQLWSCLLSVEVLSADFVRTGRAKGLSERRLMAAHVLRAAFIPILTIMGLQVAVLLAGSVVVERLFDLPGLGNLVLNAATKSDVITVRDTVMLMVGVVITTNFLVDALAAIIDPRPKVRA